MSDADRLGGIAAYLRHHGHYHDATFLDEVSVELQWHQIKPVADWSGSWAELTGYVQQAHDVGETVDPATLLSYLGELKSRALAPVRDWMKAALGEDQ